MAKYAAMICTPIDCAPDRAEYRAQMYREQHDNHETAFTVSIDSSYGNGHFSV